MTPEQTAGHSIGDGTSTRARHDALPLPAMPRLAARAAKDLMKPTKAAADGLRAVSQWFAQHGDPFDAQTPQEVTGAVAERTAAFGETLHQATLAELLAGLAAGLDALKQRMDRALPREVGE